MCLYDQINGGGRMDCKNFYKLDMNNTYETDIYALFFWTFSSCLPTKSLSTYDKYTYYFFSIQPVVIINSLFIYSIKAKILVK